MKLQFASDLHLEFPSNKAYLSLQPLDPVGNVLVLAGDIVPFAVLDQHLDFINYVSDHFETTYWIPGNHEYYHFDITEKSGVLNEAMRSNVFLVNNISVVYEKTKLIFSTLWSKISPSYKWQIERRLNDFHLIRNQGHRFSAELYNRLHAESLTFIQRELNAKPEEQTVVFTHHCPTFLNYPEHYKGDILNEAFAVELHNLIESSKIAYWVYGHHHTNTPEFTIGNTKLITNQLGYVQQNEHLLFERNKLIQL
ncbi:metallophosphoesterase [Algoriphagus sp.]|uniref:metallophosphoesterase n=1 Tax=Algoriphagus sp. TaxID=1872435 RepID=UPI002636D96E|nr:metallophosphoesterase [Algoriphagus sp.]